MKKIVTNDGSVTFHNIQYNETYHSVSGALEEAFEKFAKPCKLKDGMKVLDICFGLGYNSLAAISLANVEITALENDPIILKQIKNIKMPMNYNINNNPIKNTNNNKYYPTTEILKNNYEKIKEAADKLQYKDDKIKIKIILGDARETVKKLNERFDAVFLDPFSPKKCPELWTEDFFEGISKLMKSNSVLTTYSCAGVVRKNLEKAGFTVRDGPSIGRRAPSTIAYAI